MSSFEIGPVTPQSICTEHQDKIGSLRIGCKVCQEQAEAENLSLKAEVERLQEDKTSLLNTLAQASPDTWQRWVEMKQRQGGD